MVAYALTGRSLPLINIVSVAACRPDERKRTRDRIHVPRHRFEAAIHVQIGDDLAGPSQSKCLKISSEKLSARPGDGLFTLRDRDLAVVAAFAESHRPRIRLR